VNIFIGLICVGLIGIPKCLMFNRGLFNEQARLRCRLQVLGGNFPKLLCRNGLATNLKRLALRTL